MTQQDRNAAERHRIVAVYERVSSEKQDIARQARQREYARAAYPDYEVVVVQDDGVPASKVPIFDRPNSGPLCERIERGEVAAIFTDDQDRLHRGRLSEWANFTDVCRDNGTRLFIDGREVDLDDERDEMMSALDAIRARSESRTKSHRVRSGMREAAMKGRRNGGKRPFGFDQEDGGLVPHRKANPKLKYPAPYDETAVGLRMFREDVAGVGQQDIADGLNADGYRTVEGLLWTQESVSQQLGGPSAVKWIGHTRRKIDGEWVLHENTHEAVIRLELWAASQARRQRGKSPTKTPSKHFLLSGLLHCGRCGKQMKVRRQQKKYGHYEAYVCKDRKCSQSAVERHLIDPNVHGYFQRVGIDVDAMVAECAAARDDRLAGLRARIDNAQQQQAKAQENIDRLHAFVAEGRMTPEKHGPAVDAQEATLNAATAALDDLRAAEQALLDQPDLGDAEQKTLEALAAFKAAAAGDVASAETMTAERAALQRLFSHFVLHDFRDVANDGGKAYRLPKGAQRPARLITHTDGLLIVEPVCRPEMVVSERLLIRPGHELAVKRLRKVPVSVPVGAAIATGR